MLYSLLVIWNIDLVGVAVCLAIASLVVCFIFMMVEGLYVILRCAIEAWLWLLLDLLKEIRGR